MKIREKPRMIETQQHSGHYFCYFFLRFPPVFSDFCLRRLLFSQKECLNPKSYLAKCDCRAQKPQIKPLFRSHWPFWVFACGANLQAMSDERMFRARQGCIQIYCCVCFVYKNKNNVLQNVSTDNSKVRQPANFYECRVTRSMLEDDLVCDIHIRVSVMQSYKFSLR